jgi:hypothetical protein
MIRHLAFTLAVLVVSSAFGQAQGPDEQPWGYVYAFRSVRAFPLTREDNRLGRLPENEITLTSPLVSRRHAAIRKTDDGIVLVDVGSTNGSRLNGEALRARAPVPLAPGDRIQLADELLLFHTSIDELWRGELRLRLLSSMIRLNVHLPQDFTRKSLGQEEVVSVHSTAVIRLEGGTVELSHSVERDPSSGFVQETPAFVGNVVLDDGELELSLWAVEGNGSMTSRRAAISRLKHTTLRVALDATGYVVSELSPWFPQQHLVTLFDVLPEARDISLRFATSLASQDRPIALRDAAETLWFRHQVSAKPDAELLALSARAGGAWVEQAVLERRTRLTQIERAELAAALEDSRGRLADALALGAEGKAVDDAASVIERAKTRLAALEAR